MLKNLKRILKLPENTNFGICFEPLEPRLLLSGSVEGGIDSPSPNTFQNLQTDSTQETVAIGAVENDLALNGKYLSETSLNSSKLNEILKELPALDFLDSGDLNCTPQSSNDLTLTAVDTSEATSAEKDTDKTASNSDQQADWLGTAGRRELVFVDTGAYNYQELVDDLLAKESDDFKC